MEDLSREDLLQRIAAKLAEQPTARLKALLDQLERGKPKISRGPRPMSHAKARQIARRFDKFQASRGGGSVAKLRRPFLETLPAHLLSKPNARARGGTLTAKTLSNLVTDGRTLNEQRAALRRLVAAIKGLDRIVCHGSRPSSLARKAARIGREPRREHLEEIERLARQYEFAAHSASRALLGEDYSDSFIRLAPEK